MTNAKKTDLFGSAYLRTIFNASHDAIYVVDANDGQVVDLNDRAIELYGLASREKAIGVIIAEHRLKDEPLAQLQLLDWLEKARTEGPQVFEWISRKMDGAPLPVEMSLRKESFNERELIIATIRDISARKDAKKTLRAILDGTNDAIFIHDLKAGILVDVNRRAEEMYGYSKEEMIGRSITFISSNVKPHTEREALKWVLKVRRGKPQIIEWQAKHANGTLFPVEVSVRSEMINGLHMVIASVRDIRERKINEARLQESEQRYKALYENAPLAYQSLDEKGCFKDINPTWLKILGYAREDVLGTWFGDYLHPDFKTYFEKKFIQFKACGHISDAQFMIRHKQGHYLRIQLEGCAGYYPDGHFKETYCVFQNITKQHEAQEALKQSEQNFRALADSLPVAIYLSSGVEQSCEYINPTFTQLFGYTPKDIPTVADWWPLAYPDPDYRESLQTEWSRYREKSLENKTAFEPVESVVTCADGSTKTIQWSYVNIGEKGYAYGLDMTDIRTVERYQQLTSDVLSALNRPQKFEEAIGHVLSIIQQVTGADALGIRLADGEDFPYFVQHGFSADFLMKENSLITRDADEGICRNQDGTVCLECTCGLVLSGKTDATNPLFTPAGSCWTNDSYLLLDLPKEDDPRQNPRNNCIHNDYGSVALIPIKAGKSIVGILQLNAHSQHTFSLSAVQALEGIASHISAALLRNQSEDTLKKQYNEMERFNKAAVGRELRMIELKKEINTLSLQLNQPKPYLLHGVSNASLGSE